MLAKEIIDNEFGELETKIDNISQTIDKSNC